jgi:hypothetical protein
VKTPNRTTASAFQGYLTGEVLADSAGLQWAGLYVRLRWLLPVAPPVRILS